VPDPGKGTQFPRDLLLVVLEPPPPSHA
jgi:hypothetical protein